MEVFALLADNLRIQGASESSRPDAAAIVHWGDQTTDKMHIAFLELVIEAGANPEILFGSK